MKHFFRRFDLRAKISIVLISVIIPVYILVTTAENQLIRRVLKDEILQIGINSGKTLAAEIVSARLLSLSNPTPVIESRLQELVASQPNIIRLDVAARDPITGQGKIVASDTEEDQLQPSLDFPIVDTTVSEFKEDEKGAGHWQILVPIEQKSRAAQGTKRLLGTIHIEMSAVLIGKFIGVLWRISAAAAFFSVVTLILVLSYFLRKTISNDRLLRKAESYNLQLTEQLHDTQRELMNMEKLAVMGQLTASFAHEIGTPLNAIGGHLQLLKEEIVAHSSQVHPPVHPPVHPNEERFEIIDNQLGKIEGIVKGFLQSTAKPNSQRQLVDINKIVDKTLEIVKPRIDAMAVEIKREFNRDMGPLRIVPLDLEQVLLNLFNNSLDSIKSKTKASMAANILGRQRRLISVISEVVQVKGQQWASVSVYDTGEGIARADLNNVLKPFFTTKQPGAGTGLGLTICKQLVNKYGGIFDIDSKEGAWTKVIVKIPYQPNS